MEKGNDEVVAHRLRTWSGSVHSFPFSFVLLLALLLSWPPHSPRSLPSEADLRIQERCSTPSRGQRRGWRRGPSAKRRWERERERVHVTAPAKRKRKKKMKEEEKDKEEEEKEGSPIRRSQTKTKQKRKKGEQRETLKEQLGLIFFFSLFLLLSSSSVVFFLLVR